MASNTSLKKKFVVYAMKKVKPYVGNNVGRVLTRNPVRRFDLSQSTLCIGATCFTLKFVVDLYLLAATGYDYTTVLFAIFRQWSGEGNVFSNGCLSTGMGGNSMYRASSPDLDPKVRCFSPNPSDMFQLVHYKVCMVGKWELSSYWNAFLFKFVSCSFAIFFYFRWDWEEL